jgi:hypothetical protein
MVPDWIEGQLTERTLTVVAGFDVVIPPRDENPVQGIDKGRNLIPSDIWKGRKKEGEPPEIENGFDVFSP